MQHRDNLVPGNKVKRASRFPLSHMKLMTFKPAFKSGVKPEPLPSRHDPNFHPPQSQTIGRSDQKSGLFLPIIVPEMSPGLLIEM